MLVHIGVFIMAIAFAVFSIALSKLLLRASKSILAVQSAASNMESKLDGTITALESTLNHTKGTVSDMEVKLNALDSVFLSAENLGDAVYIMSEELDEVTKAYADTGSTIGVKPFIRTIQSVEFIKGLVASWKRGQSFSTK